MSGAYTTPRRRDSGRVHGGSDQAHRTLPQRCCHPRRNRVCGRGFWRASKGRQGRIGAASLRPHRWTAIASRGTDGCSRGGWRKIVATIRNHGECPRPNVPPGIAPAQSLPTDPCASTDHCIASEGTRAVSPLRRGRLRTSRTSPGRWQPRNLAVVGAMLPCESLSNPGRASVGHECAGDT